MIVQFIFCTFFDNQKMVLFPSLVVKDKSLFCFNLIRLHPNTVNLPCIIIINIFFFTLHARPHSEIRTKCNNVYTCRPRTI